MENASKALIIAGGMLIALIIISLLVTFYSNIRNLRQTESNNEGTLQAADFNKQYEAYNRNVYGSELVSIARRIEDYNERESDKKGYTKINMEVTFSAEAVNRLDSKKEFLNPGKYNSTKIVEIMSKIEKKMEDQGKKTVVIKNIKTNAKVGVAIKELSSMRNTDIRNLVNAEKDEDVNTTEYRNEITKYNTYKALLTQIKSTEFKNSQFDYDEYNGRITMMRYKV